MTCQSGTSNSTLLNMNETNCRHVIFTDKQVNYVILSQESYYLNIKKHICVCKLLSAISLMHNILILLSLPTPGPAMLDSIQ